ncbi:protein NipSnap homolog 3A-like isoform X2 [Lytechinus variegatus]|uniref:protein NipSnap homolog 3A-like isoform X2 n=1 Tax=Lytechinus variegatus TaxID=7654 RepID=UPI001BB1CBF4|nr:protein NipSnap homolog 3A-like isoform X2 [Lytechinus variegatus]
MPHNSITPTVSRKTFSWLKPISTQASSLQSTITRHHHDQNTALEMTDNKFYELRTYKIIPSSFPAFLKLTNENIHPRLEHSKLIGYWTTDIGGLNEVFHIWEYDCFAHRTGVRAALAKDDIWQSSYFSKAVHMMDAQDNASGMLLPWKPLQDKPLKEGGIYELRSYVIKPGGLDNMKTRIMMRDEFYSSNGCGKLIGAWMGDIGHVNMFYSLWNFVSADKRLEARTDFLQSDACKSLSPNEFLTTEMRSKIMTANPFSPLK